MIVVWEGKRVAVLGLSFKPNTNDMREAPSLWLIPKLLEAGASVQAFDPKAIPEARHILGDRENLDFIEDVTDATAEADVIIALVEWPEITQHDFISTTAKNSWFIDARNQFVPEQVERWGYSYLGIGRKRDSKNT